MSTSINTLLGLQGSGILILCLYLLYLTFVPSNKPNIWLAIICFIVTLILISTRIGLFYNKREQKEQKLLVKYNIILAFDIISLIILYVYLIGVYDYDGIIFSFLGLKIKIVIFLCTLVIQFAFSFDKQLY